MWMFLNASINYLRSMVYGFVLQASTIVCGPIYPDVVRMLTSSAVEYRKRLEDQITDNGGEYRGNLTKDITHLIAKESSGQKYNYAAQWSIKTVSMEWLGQCLERGMILEESLYHLALPVSDRGRNAWIRRNPTTTSLGKRSQEQELGSGNARKLRRTASTKLSSQNLGLWADINVHEAKPEETKKDEWHEDKDGVVNIDEGRMQGSGNATKKTVKMEREDKDANARLDLGNSFMGDRLQKRGIFQDRIFLLSGFDEKKVLGFGFGNFSIEANVALVDLRTGWTSTLSWRTTNYTYRRISALRTAKQFLPPCPPQHSQTRCAQTTDYAERSGRRDRALG